MFVYITSLVTVLAIVGGCIGIYKFYHSLPNNISPKLKGSIIGVIIALVIIFTAIIANLQNTVQSLTVGPQENTALPTLTRLVSPTAITTPTATSTPIPTPSPTPLPKPGTVLYQASTLSDWNSWALSADWKVISYNSLLISDGTANSFGGGPTAIPPYSLQGLLNFAVEATIESGANHIDESSFGIVACGSIYRAGMDYSHGPGAVILYPNNEDNFNPNATGSFDAGTAWHTYRLEVRGNTLKLLIDGAPIVNAVDGTYASCGNQIGLWGSRITLQVRSFKLIAI